MKIFKLRVEGTKKNPLLQVKVADSFLGRFLGLMGRKRMKQGEGLMIVPCNSIHMCFMRFKIDAIYIDKDFKVMKTVSNLLPWLGCSWCRGAWAVIETSSGEVERLGITKGKRLFQDD